MTTTLKILSLATAVGLCLWNSERATARSWEQIKKVAPSASAANDAVGNYDAVAISGDWAVLGAPGHGTSGAAFVLHRDQGGANNWGVVKKLLPSTGSAGLGFGLSAAISGEVIAVGAPNELADTLPTRANVGAVYIFRKDQGGSNNWGETHRLEPSGTQTAGDKFGTSVAMGPERVLVGMPQFSDGNTGTGKAQLFGLNGVGVNNWPLLAELTPSDGISGDGFGTKVAFGLTTAVATSVFRYPDKKLYLYEEDSGGLDAWGEKKIAPQGGAAAPGTFGSGVALQGTTLAVQHFGKVEIFDRNEGGASNWGAITTITGPSSSFGNALDVYGDLLVIGDISDSSAAGKAFLYGASTVRSGPAANVPARGAPWVFLQDLVANDRANGDFFGAALAIDLDTVLVGAPEDDNGEGNGAGAGYVFEDIPSADLGVTKDDGISSISAGEATTYTIQVTNHSAVEIVGATVTDQVTSGFIDPIASQWTCAPDLRSTTTTDCPVNGTVTDFANGVSVDLAAGESLTFSYEVVTESAQGPGSLVNQASVQVPSGFIDPVAGNNTAGDTNTLTVEADLELQVTPSSNTVSEGATLIFSVKAINAGPSHGSVQVQGYLPPQLTYVGFSIPENRGDGPTCSGPDERGNPPDVFCSFPAVGPGGSVTWDVELQAGVGFVGSVDSDWVAQVTFGSDPQPSNNEVTVTTLIGLSEEIFDDGFESGNLDAWVP